MKIYTKTGDDGTTALFGGDRVSKHHARVCAYGTVDELNSVVGTVRSLSPAKDLDQTLRAIQLELFDLGAELATPPARADKAIGPRISEVQVSFLESEIDRLESELPPLKTFILPGGTECAARLHWSRTVCRRAEREAIALTEQEEVRPLIVEYLNRLSDLLFVMARAANHRADTPDEAWIGRDR